MVVIKVGDASHPNAVEIATCYPDWAERNERVLDEIRGLLQDYVYEKRLVEEPYIVDKEIVLIIFYCFISFNL